MCSHDDEVANFWRRTSGAILTGSLLRAGPRRLIALFLDRSAPPDCFTDGIVLYGT